jgi:hypothetical protein
MPPTRPQTRQRGAVLRQPCYDRHRGAATPLPHPSAGRTQSRRFRVTSYDKENSYRMNPNALRSNETIPTPSTVSE